MLRRSYRIDSSTNEPYRCRATVARLYAEDYRNEDLDRAQKLFVALGRRYAAARLHGAERDMLRIVYR